MRFPVGIQHRARAATTVAIGALVTVLVPALIQPAGAADPRHVSVSLGTVAKGLVSPIGFAAPNDGTGRLFVLEQAGRIRVYSPSVGLRSTPFLDIRGRVLSGGERGLLGLAFHPSYKTNGYFYIDYTDANGNIQISRFHSVPSSNVASATETKLLTIPHPTYGNHNGGQLQFLGGYLYIGVGDGGGSGGPGGNAQSLGSLLGKILRIDVDHTCGTVPYCSPSTNPFYSTSGAKHEIWLWGLRNPWRFSFNKASGGQWIGDVGQNAQEEVDTLPAGVGGRNMGWDCYEGTLNTVSTYGGSYCTGRTFTKPAHVYSHTNGRCAIIGGYVYQGKSYPAMVGTYLYGDYCTGEIWGIAPISGVWVNALVGHVSATITSFGEAPNGELYLVAGNGVLWHVHGFHK
jgi:glucose/arabinose dehydrogenase